MKTTFLFKKFQKTLFVETAIAHSAYQMAFLNSKTIQYSWDISDFKNMLALHVAVGIIFTNVL